MDDFAYIVTHLHTIESPANFWGAVTFEYFAQQQAGLGKTA